VAECRSWLPDPIGGIFWFGVYDANTTVFNPMYCGITTVPECFKVGNGDMLIYSPTSAFWLFNRVANQCYLRYDLMSSDAKKVQKQLETSYIAQTNATDSTALKLFGKGEGAAEARAFLTAYSVKTAQNTFDRWNKLSEYLLVKYIDGNIKKEKDGKFERNKYGYPVMPSQPGYSDKWKKSVVEDTGTKLLVPAQQGH
jgi:dipeptidase